MAPHPHHDRPAEGLLALDLQLGPDGEIDEGATRPLSDMAPGERGVFTRVSDSDPAMLRFLSERGIERGAQLEIQGQEPFGGPIVVGVGRHRHSLGRELARAMRVA